MSQPISACDISMAANGDLQAFQRIIHAQTYNIQRGGGYSIFPCSCKKHHPEPTEEQMHTLNVHIGKWFEDHPVEPCAVTTGPEGNVGPVEKS